MKRGQVTYFAIAGILLVVVIFLVYFFTRVDYDSSLDLSEIDEDFVGGVSIVQECFLESSKEAVLYTLFHGGYFNGTGKSELISLVAVDEREFVKGYQNMGWFYDQQGLVAYWGLIKNDVSPSLNTFEKSMASFVESRANYCTLLLNDWSLENGVGFSVGDTSVRVGIEEENVLFEIDTAVSFEKDVVYSLPILAFKVESNSYDLYADAVKIKEDYFGDEYLDFGMYRKLNSNVSVYPYDENIVFEVINGNEKIWFMVML